MEIVLVRHGQPEWVRDGLNIDHPELTELGHVQAQRVASTLRHEVFDEIWVSPLIRAQQTAYPLLRERGQASGEQVTQDWLEEIRNPVWHGTPREKAEAAYAEERGRHAEGRWDGLTGGEPVREFVARIRLGATNFLGQRGVEASPQLLPVWNIDQPEQKILLVAHAGTNSVIVGHMLGLPPTPWEWERLVIGHGSVTRLVSCEIGDGHTFSLVKLSDVEHLATDERTY